MIVSIVVLMNETSVLRKLSQFTFVSTSLDAREKYGLLVILINQLKFSSNSLIFMVLAIITCSELTLMMG
jgi:hypothetical protein